MEENNNNEDKFKVVFTAEKDKSFDSAVDSVQKQLNKVTPEQKIRFSIDPKSRIGKDYEKQFAKWNALMKVKTTNGPFGIGKLFNDQRELADMEKYFGKLKLTAMNALSDYNDELDKLKGKNRDMGGNSLIGLTKASFDGTKQDLEEAKRKLEELKLKQNELMSNKDKLQLLPSEQDIMAEQTRVQSQMENLTKTLQSPKLKTLGDTDIVATIDKYTNQIVGKFQDAASKAAALMGRGQQDAGFTLFSEMINNIKQEQTKYESMQQQLQQEMSSLQEQNTNLQTNLNETLEKMKTSSSKKLRNQAAEIQEELDSVSQKIEATQDQMDRLNISMNINQKKLQVGEQEWLNRDTNPKVTDRGFRTEELDSQIHAALNQINKAEKELSNKITGVASTTYKDTIQTRLSALSSNASTLQGQQGIARKNDASKSNVKNELIQNQEEIKKTENQIKVLQKETDGWGQSFSNLVRQAKDLDAEMQKLNMDLQNNPLRTEFMSNAMQKMNSETESMNLKWQSGATIWEKIKGALRGVTGYIKKITPLTKLWHKVILNIYSQVATLINPLNVFTRAWDSWINRWDNLPIKNTFEVIAYNFVTILEPLFERLVQLALQLLQYVNVFTKKWFGVDLFDKQAWQIEQIKKGVGQLTASFDELHSTTDNPNQLNTIFDTGDIELDPLGEETTKKLEDWAERIGNAFKWIADNWKILVGLWAGFKIAQGLWNLFKAFGGLSNTIGGLPALWNTFKNALPIAGAIIGSVGYLYNTVKLAKNWDQMTEEERQSTGNWNMGFSALAGASIGGKIGGVPGAIIGGLLGLGVGGVTNSVIADYNGDKETAENQAAIAGGAIGAAGGMAIGKTIGTTVGGAIGGPVGAAIGMAAGAALGALVGWGAEKIGHWFTSDGDYQALKISAEDLAWANEQLTAAQDSTYQSLLNLKTLEEQTGESGEALYQSVQNGTLSMDQMTSAQLQVYQAYLKHKEAMETLREAQKTQMDYETSMDLDRAKKTDNYQSYIDKMIQANKDGIYSDEELQDRLSQVYASLDKDARETFMESIPESMRQGIIDGSEEYKSGWEKFKDNVGKWLDDFGKGWNDFWGGLGNNVSGLFQSLGNWISGKGFKDNETLNKEEYNSKYANDPNAPSYEEYKKMVNSFDVGTNYVPNDQLALVHQGEAIIPKKYNKPYTPNNGSSQLYETINNMNQEISNLRTLIQEGIPVTGTFKQRGSDLVAVTEKAKTRMGNNPVSNPAYAR